jgi:hypothetical protein
VLSDDHGSGAKGLATGRTAAWELIVCLLTFAQTGAQPDSFQKRYFIDAQRGV